MSRFTKVVFSMFVVLACGSMVNASVTYNFEGAVFGYSVTPNTPASISITAGNLISSDATSKTYSLDNASLAVDWNPLFNVSNGTVKVSSLSNGGTGFYVNSDFTECQALTSENPISASFVLSIENPTFNNGLNLPSSSMLTSSTLATFDFQASAVLGQWSYLGDLSVMTVPEPSIMALMTIGTVFLHRRRRA